MKGGVDVLLAATADPALTTSVRRTAMFGAVGAAGWSAQQLADLVAQGLGAPTACAALLPGPISADLGRSRPDLDPSSAELDPILGLRMDSPARWLSASVLRSVEGFDAELLLAASSPSAEAAFLAVTVLARTPPGRANEGKWDATSLLLTLLDGKLLHVPPSARLVSLEALGAHAAHAAVASGPVASAPLASAPVAVERLSRTLTNERADAGTRAIAARALAQLAAQGALLTKEGADGATEHAVEALAAAAASDADRYVRGYAAEALASILFVCASGWTSDAAAAKSSSALLEACRAGLEAVVSTVVVAEALRRRGEGDDPHTLVRWVCARRWCPLTTPEHPF